MDDKASLLKEKERALREAETLLVQRRCRGAETSCAPRCVLLDIVFRFQVSVYPTGRGRENGSSPLVGTCQLTRAVE